MSATVAHGEALARMHALVASGMGESAAAHKAAGDAFPYVSTSQLAGLYPQWVADRVWLETVEAWHGVVSLEGAMSRADDAVAAWRRERSGSGS